MLGKRLGRSIKDVANKIKAMSQEDILAFERAGEVTIATHCLRQTDIKVNHLVVAQFTGTRFFHVNGKGIKIHATRVSLETSDRWQL